MLDLPTDNGLTRTDEVREHPGTEFGWTLAWTESYAFGQVLLGQAVVCRLPAVGAAMLAGRIDAGLVPTPFVDAGDRASTVEQLPAQPGDIVPEPGCHAWIAGLDTGGVGNLFTAHGSATPPDSLKLSNGGTDVFFDVLTIAGCRLAETPWQQNLVLHFADGHRHSRGFSGFDLGDLPWTLDWPAEKQFFLRMIESAERRYGWDRLRYDPPYVGGQLRTYQSMVKGFTPVPVEAPKWGDWRQPPRPELLIRCPLHDLYVGEYGCRLCDPSIQPDVS